MSVPLSRYSGYREQLASYAVLALVTGLLYGHTLEAPFYLDDQSWLVDNYLLRDMAAVWERLFTQRGLTTLTFALNYQTTALALPPLHLVNIALHAGCGVLLWRLLGRLLPGRWLPLGGALLFLAHPLQTQAVTYLVQRATVLAAFFFMLAFLCHLRWRETLAAGAARVSRAALGWQVGAVLAGACAVLAKENSATLPLVLLAYDRLFPAGLTRSRWQAIADYLPFCIVPFLLGGWALTPLLGSGEALPFAGELASMRHNSPLNYLITQFSVLWIYLRLLFLPYGQALEHDFPVVAELLTVQSTLALAGLLGLGWLVWRARRRRPLLAFGVAWFFLALAVESSIIPLDPLFEHRLYLPMGGFVLALLDGISAALGERRTLLLLTAIVLLCLPLTWRRNALWTNPIAFYEDNLRVVPGSERAMQNLCVAYEKAGRFREERELLERTVRTYPENGQAYLSLAAVYREHGRSADALALLEEGIRRLPARAELYEAAAAMVRSAGDEPAIGYLLRGLAVPGIERGGLLNNLGVIYSEQGNGERAVQAFLDSLAANPRNPTAYRNLGKEYYAQGRYREAVAALNEALALQSHVPETLEGLGMAALRAGDDATLARASRTLNKVDPQGAARLQGAIRRAEAVP